MIKRRFFTCLNLEPTAFNVPVGSLVGAGTTAIIWGLAKGFLWVFAGGGVGFMVGGWISRQWFLGKLQRRIYWHFGGSCLILGSSVPASYHRKLI